MSFFFGFCYFSVMSNSLQLPWTAAHQASLSFTISWSLLRLVSIELMMPLSLVLYTISAESICRFKTDGLICLVFVYCWFWYSYMALIFPLSFMIFDWELLIIFQLNVIYFQIWFQSWAPLEITCGLFFCYFLACRQLKKFQYMYFFFFCLLDLCLCDPNRGTNF